MKSAPQIITLPFSEMEPERTVTFTCPYWDLLPPQSPEERADAQASIEEHGIKTPLVVCSVMADHWLVIDGYNRLVIAEASGLYADDVPLHCIGEDQGFEEDELTAMAKSLNEDRRQLSEEYQAKRREERKARVAAARGEGKSLRAIAEAEGISKSQVAKDLQVSTGGHLPEPPKFVTGTDGKTYRAVEYSNCANCGTKISDLTALPFDGRNYCEACFDLLPTKEAPTTLPCDGCGKIFDVELLTHNDGKDLCEACFDIEGAAKEAELGKPAPSLSIPGPLERSKNIQEMFGALPEAPKSELEASVDAALAKAPQILPKQTTPKEDREAFSAKQETNRQAKHHTIATEAKAASVTGKLGPFSVLYIDPPWRYDTAGVSADRTIENHYPTMTLEDLKAIDIDRIATKNAVLYLWVTAPMVVEACELLKAWGFTYKSQAVWIKEGGSPGLGHWWRVDHELLYVATRGSFPTPPLAARFSSVIKEQKGRHSEKPAKVRELLDRMYPNHPKVEIFARAQAPGWTCLGNEIDGADIRELLKKGVDPRQVALPQEVKPLPKEPAPEAPAPSTNVPGVRTFSERIEELRQAPTWERAAGLHDAIFCDLEVGEDEALDQLEVAWGQVKERLSAETRAKATPPNTGPATKPEAPKKAEEGSPRPLHLAKLEACTTREEYTPLWHQLLSEFGGGSKEHGEMLSHYDSHWFALPTTKKEEKATPPSPELLYFEAWLKEGAVCNSKNGYALSQEEAREVCLTPKQFASWQKDDRLRLRTTDWLEQMAADLKLCNTVGEGMKVFDAAIDLTVTRADREKVTTIFSEWKQNKPATTPYNAKKARAK